MIGTFITGLIIGSVFGVFLVGLCMAAKDRDNDER